MILRNQDLIFLYQFVLFQKISHESDIVFDDSPLDGSEGQQLLHARSVNEIENNDEHWLWAHVDRIKRSIESVLGNGKEHGNKRMKRGLFDWDWGDDSKTEAPTTQSSNTEASTTPFNIFGLFGNDETPTTPKDDGYHQNDASPEEETTNQEDLDIDLTDGSGSSRDDEPTTDAKSQFCELRVFIFLVFFVSAFHF